MTPVSDGRRWWVPGNRWDLGRDEVRLERTDRVAVVMPYFEQPDSLRRMYAALQRTTLPSSWEVVVVDDGSRRPPPSPPASLGVDVRVLRQEDRGVRPAAARDLGVRATDADVLVFLDPDTIPAPRTVEHLAAWPATLPDAVVVGRRRHVDLRGWDAALVGRWLDGEAPAPPSGADPAWLDDGYRTTGNLLCSDRRSYRFVISGVMACHRSLYDDIGGFAVERDEYGAEDWELAARAYDAGAVLVHDPRAVTYHDEPDWADRDEDVRSKQHETAWLAANVTEPSARGSGLRHHHADLVSSLSLGEAPWQDWVGTLNCLLHAAPDQRVHLPADVDGHVRRLVAADPRVVVGPPTAECRPHGAAVLDVVRPHPWDRAAIAAVVGRLLADDLGAVDAVCAGRLVATARNRRAIGRRRRAAAFGVDTSTFDDWFPTGAVDLPAAKHPGDLAAWIACTL